MTRFFKRLLFALGTLGLGALAYALLRAEDGESAPAVRTSEPEPSRPRPEPEPRPAPKSRPAPKPQETSAEPPVCAGRTKSGKRCSRPAQPGSKYCWQHGG